MTNSCHHLQRSRQRMLVAIGGVLCLLLLLSFSPARAQQAPVGILMPGSAAVTGFPGVLLPNQIAPGTDPADQTFIDLSGPSLRVVDLRAMPGPPTAQLVAALKPYTATAAQIGQTFAVTLDNTTPPNIYAAASSAYGLPIVAPGAGGQLQHIPDGALGAAFMPGLWGGAAANGGPGSIWKIDGVTGAVSLFANVTLDGAGNSGPALGGLAFDAASNSLFVADRQTGMIHRFAMNGTELGRYDHGVQGRQARALPPVPFDPADRLDITSPKFDSTQSTTFGYAAPGRRVFGLAVFRQRLYYAVAAGEQVWSVGLMADGSFGADARPEVAVAAGPTANEISKIAFDDYGRMFLAERPAPSGAYDFEALTAQGIGRVLRYVNENGSWQPMPDEYAIGFPAALQNGNGGVAIGFSYDEDRQIDRAACGEFLWSSGEQLRVAADPAIAAQLAPGGPANVDGLQGNEIWLTRPNNAPPFKSYFIDYDDKFDDVAARGHMGDITIWRSCSPALRGGWMMPDWLAGWIPTFSLAAGLPAQPPSPPNQSCPPAQSQPGYRCCPIGTTPDLTGQCKPWCPSLSQDPQSLRFCALGFDPASYDPNNAAALRCIGGAAPGGGLFGCVKFSPVLNAPVCPAGWTKQSMSGIGSICTPTPQQMQCQLGQQVSAIDNQCHGLCLGTAWPATQCCRPGSVLSSIGTCCPSGSTPDPVSGQCSPPPPTSNSNCRPGTFPTGYGTCCANGSVVSITGVCCPQGSTPDPATGQCSSSSTTPGSNCSAPGQFLTSFNTCCTIGSVVSSTGACCPSGSTPDPATGQCSSSTTPSNSCGLGRFLTKNGTCCILGSVVSSTGACCPIGSTPDPNTGQCSAPTTPIRCRLGEFATPEGTCCPLELVVSNTGACCPRGSTPDPKTGKCSPPPSNSCGAGYVQIGTNAPDTVPGCCLAGQVTSTGICCSPGQMPGGPNNSACLGTGNSCTPPLVQVGTQCCSQADLQPGGKCAACGAGTEQTCSVAKNANGAYGVTCSCCASGQVTATGACCPAGTTPGGPNNTQCEPPPPPPPLPNACCTPGWILTPNPSVPNSLQNPSTMTCCLAADVTSDGICCSGPVDPKNRRSCPSPRREEKKACAQGYRAMPDGTCCNNRLVSADGTSCNATPTVCAPGEFRDTTGACTPISSAGCAPGEKRNDRGVCERPCRVGEERNADGNCVTPTCCPQPPVGIPSLPTPCQAGQTRNAEGFCVTIPKPVPVPTSPTPTTPLGMPSLVAPCPAGETRGADGLCRPIVPPKPPCQAGEERNANGTCVLARKPGCSVGEERNADGACVPVHTPSGCLTGEVRTLRGCEKQSEPEPKINEGRPSKIEQPRIEAPKVEPKVELPKLSPPPKLGVPLKLPERK